MLSPYVVPGISPFVQSALRLFASRMTNRGMAEPVALMQAITVTWFLQPEVQNVLPFVPFQPGCVVDGDLG